MWSISAVQPIKVIARCCQACFVEDFEVSNRRSCAVGSPALNNTNLLPRLECTADLERYVVDKASTNATSFDNESISHCPPWTKCPERMLQKKPTQMQERQDNIQEQQKNTEETLAARILQREREEHKEREREEHREREKSIERERRAQRESARARMRARVRARARERKRERESEP